MKFLKLLAALLCAQALIVSADEKDKAATEANGSKPTLSYYYFDG